MATGIELAAMEKITDLVQSLFFFFSIIRGLKKKKKSALLNEHTILM